MSGGEVSQAAKADAEQIGNAAIRLRKPNWPLFIFLAVISVATVALQIVGLMEEGKWEATLNFWNVAFSLELWAKAGGIILAGLVGLISALSASVEVYAINRQTTNIKHEHHHHHKRPPARLPGIENVEAAIGKLPSTEDFRRVMLEHLDTTKSEKVEINRDDLRAVLQPVDVIRDLTTAGGLQKITGLQNEVSSLGEQLRTMQDSWNRERVELQSRAETREHHIKEVEEANAALDANLATATAANIRDTAEIGKLNADLSASLAIVKRAVEFSDATGEANAKREAMLLEIQRSGLTAS